MNPSVVTEVNPLVTNRSAEESNNLWSGVYATRKIGGIHMKSLFTDRTIRKLVNREKAMTAGRSFVVGRRENLRVALSRKRESPVVNEGTNAATTGKVR